MSESKSCAVCGEEATCVGQYEGEEEQTYSCDDCCDHSNEDGQCRPITDED